MSFLRICLCMLLYGGYFLFIVCFAIGDLSPDYCCFLLYISIMPRGWLRLMLFSYSGFALLKIAFVLDTLERWVCIDCRIRDNSSTVTSNRTYAVESNLKQDYNNET